MVHFLFFLLCTYFLDLTPHPTVALAKLWIFEMHITYMYVHTAQTRVNKSLTPLLHALELLPKPPDIWRPEPNFAGHWDREFSNP
jgi:hypothetical protein